MSVDFNNSETKTNLMRAFAGESQARNRYTIAASEAKKQNLHVVEAAFIFTADQEKEHAEIFYNLLRECSGENICIEGCYPIDLSNSVAELLRFAEHNELEEYDDVYKNFAEKAKEEGFEKISSIFSNIANIEKTHSERFQRLAQLLEENKLFVSDISCKWMCLNCGYVIESKGAPSICPVCEHNQGYFIRLELAPYTK